MPRSRAICKFNFFDSHWPKAVQAACLFLCANAAYGQSSVGIDIDHLTRQGVDQRLQSDGVDLLGEAIDLNTGSVVFSHTDISIPGNFDLEVSLRRTRSTGRRYVNDYDFADWEIETPRITVIVALSVSIKKFK